MNAVMSSYSLNNIRIWASNQVLVNNSAWFEPKGAGTLHTEDHKKGMQYKDSVW